MKATHLNAFLEAAYSAISGMAGLGARKKSIRRVEPGTALDGICAMVSISGDLSGMVIIVFPPKTALEICSMSLHGLKLYDDDREILADSIREIASRIASDACASLSGESLSLRVDPPKIRWEFEKTLVPDKIISLAIDIETRAGDLSFVAGL